MAKEGFLSRDFKVPINGEIVEFKEGTSFYDVEKELRRRSTGLTGGLDSSFLSGIESLKGSISALPSMIFGDVFESQESLDEAGKIYRATQEEQRKLQPLPTTREDVVEAYEKEGISGALPEAYRFGAQAIGQTIPYTLPSLAAASAARTSLGVRAASMIGRAVPLLARAGAAVPSVHAKVALGVLAGVGTMALQFLGDNLQRQYEVAASEDPEGRVTPDDITLYSAALAAGPQAAMDFITIALTSGLGRGVQIAAAKSVKDSLKLAGGTARAATFPSLKESAKEAFTESLIEFPTELAQTVLERAQAGESISFEDANFVSEMMDVVAGTAPVVGAFGSFGTARAYRSNKKAFDNWEKLSEKEKEIRNGYEKRREDTLQRRYEESVARYKDNLDQYESRIAAEEAALSGQRENIEREAQRAKDEFPVDASDVTDAARSRNIKTNDNAFKSFVYRSTGGRTSNLNETTQDERSAMRTILSGLTVQSYFDEEGDGVSLPSFTSEEFDSVVKGFKSGQKITSDAVRKRLNDRFFKKDQESPVQFADSEGSRIIANSIIEEMKRKGYAVEEKGSLKARKPKYTEAQYEALIEEAQDSGSINRGDYERITGRFNEEDFNSFVSDATVRGDLSKTRTEEMKSAGEYAPVSFRSKMDESSEDADIRPLLNKNGSPVIKAGAVDKRRILSRSTAGNVVTEVMDSQNGFFVVDEDGTVVGGSVNKKDAEKEAKFLNQNRALYRVFDKTTGNPLIGKYSDVKAAVERSKTGSAGLPGYMRGTARLADYSGQKIEPYKGKFSVIDGEGFAVRQFVSPYDYFKNRATGEVSRSENPSSNKRVNVTEITFAPTRDIAEALKDEYSKSFEPGESNWEASSERAKERKKQSLQRRFLRDIDSAVSTAVLPAEPERLTPVSKRAKVLKSIPEGSVKKGEEILSIIDSKLKEANLSKEVIASVREKIGSSGINEGAYSPNDDGFRRIAISLEAVSKAKTNEEMRVLIASIMDHEIVHAMRDLDLFTIQEWNVLSNSTYRVRNKDGQTFFDWASQTYQGMGDAEYILEEAVAEMYRQYYSVPEVRRQIAGKPRTLIERIAMFLEKMFNALSGAGFVNAADVISGMKKIQARERGEVRTIQGQRNKLMPASPIEIPEEDTTQEDVDARFSVSPDQVNLLEEVEIDNISDERLSSILDKSKRFEYSMTRLAIPFPRATTEREIGGENGSSLRATIPIPVGESFEYDEDKNIKRNSVLAEIEYEAFGDDGNYYVAFEDLLAPLGSRYGRTNKLGSRKARSLFATIFELTEEVVKSQDFKSLYFDAASDLREEPDGTFRLVKTRQRLYGAGINNIAKKYGYRLIEERTEGGSEFILEKTDDGEYEFVLRENEEEFEERYASLVDRAVPYPYEISRPQSRNVRATFTTENNVPITLNADTLGDSGDYSVSFRDNEMGYGVTGLHGLGSIRIFKTIFDIMEEIILSENPRSIEFSAATARSNESQQQKRSRIKIYRRGSKQLGEKFGYKVREDAQPAVSFFKLQKGEYEYILIDNTSVNPYSFSTDTSADSVDVVDDSTRRSVSQNRYALESFAIPADLSAIPADLSEEIESSGQRLEKATSDVLEMIGSDLSVLPSYLKPFSRRSIKLSASRRYGDSYRQLREGENESTFERRLVEAKTGLMSDYESFTVASRVAVDNGADYSSRESQVEYIFDELDMLRERALNYKIALDKAVDYLMDGDTATTEMWANDIRQSNESERFSVSPYTQLNQPSPNAQRSIPRVNEYSRMDFTNRAVRDFNDERLARAYHGSGEDFDKFSSDFIGTGERAQAFGWGLYFTDLLDIAKFYRQTVAKPIYGRVEIGGITIYKAEGKPADYGPSMRDSQIDGVDPFVVSEFQENMMLMVDEQLRVTGGADQAIADAASRYVTDEIIEARDEGDIDRLRDWSNLLSMIKEEGAIAEVLREGQIYEVEIPEKEELFDYHASMRDQSPKVIEAFRKAFESENMSEEFNELYGEDGDESAAAFYDELSFLGQREKYASELLNKYGVKGHYYNAGALTPDVNTDAKNYVIYDDKAISIVKKLYANKRPAFESDERLSIRSASIADGNTKPERLSASNKNRIVRTEPRVDRSIEQILNTLYAKPNVQESFFDKIKSIIFDDEKRKEYISRFRSAFLDKYDYIAKVNKKASLRKRDERELLASTNAHSLWLLADRSNSLTSAMINNGAVVLRGGIARIDPTRKSLMQALQPLFESNEYLYREWATWMVANRSTNIMRSGRLTPLSQEEVNRVNDYVNRSGNLQLFESVRRDYEEWNGSLVEFLKDTGVINDELARVFVKYADYIPFYRNLDLDGTGEEGVRPEVFKQILQDEGIDLTLGRVRRLKSLFPSLIDNKVPRRMKGGEQQLDDPLTGIMKNLSASITAGMKNLAAQQTMKDAVDAGIATEVFADENGYVDPAYYTVRVNGEERYFDVTDDKLVAAIEGFTRPNVSISPFFAKPASWLRESVARSPMFIFRNLFRDSVSSYVTSGVEMKPVIDTMNKFIGDLSGDRTQTYSVLENAGIVGGYDYVFEPKKFEENFRKKMRKQGMTMKKGSVDSVTPIFSRIWDSLGEASQVSDAATRQVVYEDTLQRLLNKGVGRAEAEAEAIFQAMEVLNFTRKGNNAFLNTILPTLPFFNARMQGLDVIYRSVTGEYSANRLGKEEAQASFLRRGLFLAAMTVLYTSLSIDDEEYKGATDAERDDNWLITLPGQTTLKIPIPFEVGLIFKVAPEHITRAILQDESLREAANSVTRGIVNSLELPLTGPQAVAPIFEVLVNKSWFTGKPIVPEYMQDRPKELQAKYYTSEFAKQLSYLSPVPLSPLSVEHVLEGYAGTMGSYMLGVLDSVTSLVSGKPIMMNWRQDEIPIVGAIFQSANASEGQTQRWNDFFFSVRGIVSGLRDLEEEDPERAMEMRQKYAEVLAMKSSFESIQTRLNDLRSMKTRVFLDKNMDDSQKRDIIDSIDLRIKQILSNTQEFTKMMPGPIPFFRGIN
jgi:hypothetical protein